MLIKIVCGVVVMQRSTGFPMFEKKDRTGQDIAGRSANKLELMLIQSLLKLTGTGKVE